MALHLQHLGFTYKLSLSQAGSGDARTQTLYFLITTPGEENAFRQLRLNQWVKQAVRCSA